MSTVYEKFSVSGNVKVVNDLIFGWTVVFNDDPNMTAPISADCLEVEHLRILYQCFGTGILYPDELKELIRRELGKVEGNPYVG